MPGGRRPSVSTESLILLSNSDDSKFCSFSMKPLARRVTTLSRRRFGSMFLPCWLWFSSGVWPWQILDMDSNSTNQTVKATCMAGASHFRKKVEERKKMRSSSCKFAVHPFRSGGAIRLPSSCRFCCGSASECHALRLKRTWFGENKKTIWL